MVGNRVAFVVDAPNDRGIALHHATNHEEGCLDALGRERVENAVGVGRQRTIVEGQDDFVVHQRQGFGILKAAEAQVLIGIDHERAADPERIGRAFGSTGTPHAEERGEQDVCGNGAAHGPVSTPVWTNSERTLGVVSLAHTLPEH